MQIRWKGSKRGTSGGTFRNLKSQESKRTSSESTVRRTTAKSVDWACNRELSGDRARRRATGNLDSKASREIIDLLKMSNQKYNQTVIVITHDENIALEADRILTIDDGKIVKDERVR